MLKIINHPPSVQLNKFAVDPKEIFSPGMIAQAGYNGVIVSDGTFPLGIIDDIQISPNNNTTGYKYISVWSGIDPFEIETNMFNIAACYNPGDPLFCSKDGLFDSIPQSAAHPCVGHVSKVIPANYTNKMALGIIFHITPQTSTTNINIPSAGTLAAVYPQTISANSSGNTITFTSTGINTQGFFSVPVNVGNYNIKTKTEENKKCECGGEKANTTHSNWCPVWKQ